MKKILFNDKYGLTEAVLSGRKTMTRRIVPKSLLNGCDLTENPIVFIDTNGDWHDIRESKYAFKVGEIVAVAQNYKEAGFNPDVLQISTSISIFTLDVPISSYPGWRNKMFIIPALMPHKIRITNVRVERLQDISFDDCFKEGITSWRCQNKRHYGFFDNDKGVFSRHSTPREAYAALIDKVSGKGVWDSNPYVFAYDFELVK